MIKPLALGDKWSHAVLTQCDIGDPKIVAKISVAYRAVNKNVYLTRDQLSAICQWVRDFNRGYTLDYMKRQFPSADVRVEDRPFIREGN